MLADIYESYVRPRLPKHTRVLDCNGVDVRIDDVCAVDTVLPFYEGPWYVTDDLSNYEAQFADSIRQYVEKGDSVVEIGGGYGVTAVVAAQQVGHVGSIRCYEGSAELAAKIEETATLNSVSESIEVEHAVVGDPIDLHGQHGFGSEDRGASIRSPRDLPECDVLAMDCEGSEVQILGEMEIRPKTVIVETHGVYGAPTSQTIDVLESNGYEIECQRMLLPEADLQNVVAIGS